MEADHAILHAFFVERIEILENDSAHLFNGRATVNGKFSEVLPDGGRLALRVGDVALSYETLWSFNRPPSCRRVGMTERSRSPRSVSNKSAAKMRLPMCQE